MRQTHCRQTFYSKLQLLQLPMFHKALNALPTAVPATKPMEKKESMLKESEPSALLVISVLLKILSSTNLATPKKPPLVLLTRTVHASSTTKVHNPLEAFAFRASAHAQLVDSVLEPQEPPSVDHDTPSLLYSFFTYMLINFPRNYSLVHF